VESTTRSRGAFVRLLLAVALVAVNLRIALSSFPAVVVLIQEQTSWSDALIGAFTTIPVLCMGLFALLVSRLTHYVGRSFAVSLALVIMMVAMLLRLAGAQLLTLALSAVLAGASIAIIGGLVPTIVKEQLKDRVGTATSVWTASMMAGAAVGAIATLPLATVLGSWNRALAFWALPAVLGLIAWTIVERPKLTPRKPAATPVRLRDYPWTNPLAWSLTALTTLNSIVFYSAIAWIAPSYVERGYSPETAALFFGLFTGVHIAGALILPAWAMRSRYRRTVFLACLIVSTVAILLIAFAPRFAPGAVIAVFGFTLSGGFAIPLGMLSEYPATTSISVGLTSMAMSVTFTIAAFGPLLAGLLMDVVDSWTLVYALLALVVVMQMPAVRQLRRGALIN